MLTAGLALLLLHWPADRTHDGTPAAGASGDTVKILEPEHEAYYPDAPQQLTVIVEVTNASTLEIQEVHLEVDGDEHRTMCEAAGICEFEVELSEGVHEFRSFVVRNIGGPLFSQFVVVQVGGDPPGADDSDGGIDDGIEDGTDGAATSQGSTGSGTSEAGSSGADSDDGTGGEGGDGADDGAPDDCACRSGSGTPAHWVLLGLVATGVCRRRR